MIDYVAVWKGGFWNAVPRDQACNCADAPLTPADAMARCPEVAALVAYVVGMDCGCFDPDCVCMPDAITPFTKA